jgi:thioredoxin 1
MTLFTPSSAALGQALQADNTLLVVCFCAAWCDTCTEYKAKFQGLAAQYPEVVFVWADIEEFPDLLGDEDVENFPTLAIERAGDVLFYGVMLPHIGQLERLIQTFTPESSTDPIQTTLAPLRESLKESFKAE